MSISNAIELVAIVGRRCSDGTLLIDGERLDGFPPEITIDGATFDFSEEEEIDHDTRDHLGHYFRRGHKP